MSASALRYVPEPDRNRELHTRIVDLADRQKPRSTMAANSGAPGDIQEADRGILSEIPVAWSWVRVGQ
jgi:hypothetical protein